MKSTVTTVTFGQMSLPQTNKSTGKAVFKMGTMETKSGQWQFELNKMLN